MGRSSSSSDDERVRRRERVVETVFPSVEAAAEADDERTHGPRSPEPDAPPSTDSGNANAAPADIDSIAAKAIEKLPPELAALAKDPKRHAKSKDPGWKFGFWANEGNKELVQCIICKKVVPAGIKRFKQHLAGGYDDAEKCPNAPAIVRKQMDDYLKKNSRAAVARDKDEEADCEPESEGEVQEVARDQQIPETARAWFKRQENQPFVAGRISVGE